MSCKNVNICYTQSNLTKKVVIDKSTRMALKHQPTSSTYDSYKDIITSHHYFISTENKVWTEFNFCRTFFELNYDYKKQFLGTSKAKCDEDLRKRARMKGPSKKEHQDMIKLKKMYRYLSINNNFMYVDQWNPIAKIAMTMWQNKVKSDMQSIHDRFTIPSVIQYFAGDKLHKMVYSEILVSNNEWWIKIID